MDAVPEDVAAGVIMAAEASFDLTLQQGHELVCVPKVVDTFRSNRESGKDEHAYVGFDRSSRPALSQASCLEPIPPFQAWAFCSPRKESSVQRLGFSFQDFVGDRNPQLEAVKTNKVQSLVKA